MAAKGIWSKKWDNMTEDEKKTLRKRFFWWRLANWALVSFLVVRAVFALTWLLPGEPKAAVRLVAAIAVIAYALINVMVWSNQTDKDIQRMGAGVRLTLLATAVIVASRMLRYLGVLFDILLVSANFWPVIIVYPLLAGALCFSITKEKQMTDSKLSKDRTPPKKTHKKGKIGNTEVDFEEWQG